MLFRAGSSLLKNPNRPLPFHAPILHSSERKLLRELMAMIVDHHTDMALEFVEYSIMSVSHKLMTCISLM